LKNHNLSLQGISGIFYGVISLLYIYLLFSLIGQFSAGESIGMLPISFFEIFLLILTLVYILISFLIIVQINKQRRKRFQFKGWEVNSQRILKMYTLFLILGGILTYILVSKGILKAIIPISLILYGVASIFVNKSTNGPTLILGLLFLTTGITAYFFPQYMFYLWAISFGVFHIIYGLFEINKP